MIPPSTSSGNAAIECKSKLNSIDQEIVWESRKREVGRWAQPHGKAAYAMLSVFELFRAAKENL